MMIFLAVLIQYTSVTDRPTDDGKYTALYALRRAVKIHLPNTVSTRGTHRPTFISF